MDLGSQMEHSWANSPCDPVNSATGFYLPPYHGSQHWVGLPVQQELSRDPGAGQGRPALENLIIQLLFMTSLGVKEPFLGQATPSA